MRAFQYLAPASLEELLPLLAQHQDKAVILNGGTDIVIQLRERLIAPDYVIDIKGIPGLREIAFSEAEGLTIGACVTMNELAEHPVVRERYPFLAEAASSVGSYQVRNRATCAGNLINASPLADTATPLLVCDAVLLCVGPKGVREIPLREFFVFVRKTVLGKDEVVTGIRVPATGLTGVFSKISRRRKVDLSTVCGTVARVGSEYRAAFGAVAPTPLRMPKTEAFLCGKALSPAVIDEAIAIAQGEASPIDDVRAGKEYRLEMVGVILKRALETLGEVTA